MMDTANTNVKQVMGAAPIGMSVQDFAAACGVTRMTANRWSNSGKVDHIEVNGNKRITSDPADFLPAAGHRTVAEFAAACGVSRQVVYYWIETGRVEYPLVNGKRRVTSDPSIHRRH